ncbi:MAG: glutathione synthase [Candidatus Omnitrophica bacterium]|nr:glutathione synthase [Candidatus Omnitrophota bacterium]
MDPLEKLDLEWDTSLCLLRELARRGHQTFLFPADNVSLVSGRVKARGYLLKPLGGQKYHKRVEKSYDLAGFDAVFIRKDPPFDGGYLALTYLLEGVARKTVVINSPRGIRNANEKLFGLLFSRGSPLTLVSSKVDEIVAFQKKIRSDLVVKPLYEKGGKGVFLFRRNRRDDYLLLKKATLKETQAIVAQKFIPDPKNQGDKRILLWKGKILGVFARVPQVGEFRSNLSLGGRFEKCSVTPTEIKIVNELRPILVREGLYFVGIDVRQGRLIEVNVTSPAGLVELDLLYKRGATKELVDSIEKTC